MAGSESTSNGVLTVTASGAAIHGTSDQFRLISEPVTGDFPVERRHRSQSTQNTQPQAGLMVRQSTDPTSPYYAVIAYPNDLTEATRRRTSSSVPVRVRRQRDRADQALSGRQADLG